MAEPAIRKAVVVGAGTMGSGIAAHLANAGLEVLLLDLDAAVAEAGVARELNTGGFMDRGLASRVRTGSMGADLHRAADADWIVEAVAERLDVKQGLYAALDAVRRPGSIISSNTSTIPLARLVEGLPLAFAGDFLITHFFNPPRRMPLLELVTGSATRPAVRDAMRHFADHRLGKAVVRCKDTPGFIANRIGGLWLAAALNEAIRLGLTVEDADAAIGRPFGIPATGIFGLMDLIGIDLVVAVVRSLQGALPPADAIHAYSAAPPLVERMLADRRLGRKTGAGFVRMAADRKSRQVVDLRTGEYRPQAEPSQAVRDAKGAASVLLRDPGPAGEFVRRVMGATLAYAAVLVPEIADTPLAVDEAMRAGYGWRQGPFELIDALGPTWLTEHLAHAGQPVPPFLLRAADGFYTPRPGQARLPDGGWHRIETLDGVLSVPPAGDPVLVQSDSDHLMWDLGDGVAGLAFRTKGGTLTPGLLDAIHRVLLRTADGFGALVIVGAGASFSTGGNLRHLVELVERGDEAALSAYVDAGLTSLAAIRSAPFPVVGAASGQALGGGLELLMHCDAVVAHAELSAGLPESRLGLLPAWGGCRALLRRLARQHRGPVAPALAAFPTLATGASSGSAAEARNLGLLARDDGITMNTVRVLADAKARALAMMPGYQVPEPAPLVLSGPSGAAALRNILDTEDLGGRLTPHDRTVGEALCTVLSGRASADPIRPVADAAVAGLEKEAFLHLARTPASLARMRHMLDTGKVLRN